MDHASRCARAQPGVLHRLAATGTAIADGLAKKAAAIHPLPVNIAVCVDRGSGPSSSWSREQRVSATSSAQATGTHGRPLC